MTVRIVAMADTHLYHRSLRVPDGDLLVHAGDLCRRGTLAELAIATDWLHELPHRHKIVVAGNHDWPLQTTGNEARALLGDDIVYLEEQGATVLDLRIWGSPWQPEFFGWAFNLPRGPALAEKWAAIPMDLDVLITHGPPRGIGDRVSSTRAEGDDDLLERVRIVRPRLHLFGHIHEDGGVWDRDGTMFANVTTNEGERQPTVIDLDPRDGSIRVVSVPA